MALASLLNACAPLGPPAPLPGHMLAEETTPRREGIPPIVPRSLIPPQPKAQPPIQTFSAVVQAVPAREILFALARDGKINMDIHPGIEGQVTLNAIDQTLPQILERIAQQVDIRWEFQGPNLAVMPDSPFLRIYKVDYLNMARDASGTLSVTTQVASNAPGSAGTIGPAAANNSMTRIENVARNHFWDDIVQDIKDILRETDKILPEGSSEEEEEVSGNVATSGTGAQPARTAGRRRQPVSATTVLAASPNPAELQNRGTRIVRRTTFREAASVIAHAETGIINVRATSRQHARIQEFLDQAMQSARRQVLIEATVAEVRLDRNYQQGIDWSRVASGTGFSLLQRSAAGSTLNQGAGALAQIGYVNANSAIGNIGATVKLLESFGTVKVISSPKISVLNNQTAVLKVVDNEVYFTIKADITPGNQNTNALTSFTSTVNSVPVGFVMNVTPQISEAEAIVLNVRPSISRKIGFVLDPSPDLAKANIQSPIPVIRTREMESVLRIENGHIAVMGGLMEDALSNQDDTIPLVNRIPILGNLLANRNDNLGRTELIIFLRPTLIREASLEGDYQTLQKHLPGRDYFRHEPGIPEWPGEEKQP